MIFHSRVTDFEKNESDSGLSVKMVLEGCEEYKIGNLRHRIRKGEFLLVNEHQQFECRVHSKVEVEGLCIYLDPDTVRDIHHSSLLGHAKMLDQGTEIPDQAPACLEKIYGLEENTLGGFLKQAAPILRDEEARQLVDYHDFFLHLSENLVASQGEVRQLIGRLDLERPSTRQEIFRRVSQARNYIDCNYLEDISLDELAEKAFLSKYHFLRCFKQVYQRSPYQYVLHRRLEKGKELLEKSACSLSEIAYLTGFTDRRAFNKAFRKAMGLNPGAYRAQL